MSDVGRDGVTMKYLIADDASVQVEPATDLTPASGEAAVHFSERAARLKVVNEVYLCEPGFRRTRCEFPARRC